MKTRENMRIFIVIVTCLLLSPIVKGQIKSKKVVKSGLPKSIKYQGKLKQGIQFQDNTGTYLALTAETGEQPQKDDDEFKQAHLYSYLYQVKGAGQASVVWQLHDMVTDCDLDMKAEFVPGSLTITDLDKNGKAEVWVAYRMACNGDISPSELKVVMQEQTINYSKQGVGKIKIGNSVQPDGGEITSNTFKKSPAVFKQYSDQLWKKYLLEIN